MRPVIKAVWLLEDGSETDFDLEEVPEDAKNLSPLYYTLVDAEYIDPEDYELADGLTLSEAETMKEALNG